MPSSVPAGCPVPHASAQEPRALRWGCWAWRRAACCSGEAWSAESAIGFAAAPLRVPVRLCQRADRGGADRAAVAARPDHGRRRRHVVLASAIGAPLGGLRGGASSPGATQPGYGGRPRSVPALFWLCVIVRCTDAGASCCCIFMLDRLAFTRGDRVRISSEVWDARRHCSASADSRVVQRHLLRCRVSTYSNHGAPCRCRWRESSSIGHLTGDRGERPATVFWI